MHHVLLADNLKSSLVMTSEIFKDHIRECAIHIVGSGKECVEYLSDHTPDMVVVDFDLPDTDGVMLSKLLRKSYNGPVIITAYPHKIVDEAIQKELYAYNDSYHWVKKPVRMEAFSEVIDQFLLGNRRVSKRFEVDYIAHIVERSGERGKRSLKADGRAQDISIGGVKIHCEGGIPMETGHGVTLSLAAPGGDPIENPCLKVRARWAWKDDQGLFGGLCFVKLTEGQRAFIEDVIKGQSAIEDQIECLEMRLAS